jgi:uncharacterized protein YndB with AHSA1/START domain
MKRWWTWAKAQENVRTMINSRSTTKSDDYDHEHNEGRCLKKRQQTWLVAIVGTQKKALTMIRIIRKGDDDD